LEPFTVRYQGQLFEMNFNFNPTSCLIVVALALQFGKILKSEEPDLGPFGSTYTNEPSPMERFPTLSLAQGRARVRRLAWWLSVE
jgi:hypothetical protein